MVAEKAIWINDEGKVVDKITEGGGTLLAAQGSIIPDDVAEKHGLTKTKAVKPSEDKGKHADKS